MISYFSFISFVTRVRKPCQICAQRKQRLGNRCARRFLLITGRFYRFVPSSKSQIDGLCGGTELGSGAGCAPKLGPECLNRTIRVRRCAKAWCSRLCIVSVRKPQAASECRAMPRLFADTDRRENTGLQANGAALDPQVCPADQRIRPIALTLRHRLADLFVLHEMTTAH